MIYSLKEQAVRNYISKINFKGDWNYAAIEEDMKRFLGERPILEPSYKKDIMMNEITGDTKEIKKLEKISIIFTNDDDKIKKVEFLID